MTRAMKLASARGAEVEVRGLRVVVGPGVCNPSPALGMSFAPLFEAALEGVSSAERVLDVGTGSGIWALLALRRGAQVTATDLPHVPFDALEASARANDLPPPRALHGDLFEPVAGERFDRVVFNPPFHFGVPRDDAERAYLGGADGEVVRRFLGALPAHLAEGGAGYLILPAFERARYEDSLAPLSVRVRADQWMPLVGCVELLSLRP